MTNLIEAIDQYIEAKKDYDKKAEKCQYDRSYFLYDEQERVEKCKELMSIAFEAEVLKVIQKQLGNETKI